MGRPRLFNEDESLDAAVRAFWMRGYRAASVDELLRVMNMSRASLYRTFGCKRELFERVLRTYRSRHVEPLLDVLRSGRGLPALFEWLERSLEQSRTGVPNGCLLAKAREELVEDEPELANVVSDCIQETFVAVREAFEDAKRLHQIPADADTQALAKFFCSLHTGLTQRDDLALTWGDVVPMIEAAIGSLPGEESPLPETHNGR